jgi:hypothetical protein
MDGCPCGTVRRALEFANLTDVIIAPSITSLSATGPKKAAPAVQQFPFFRSESTKHVHPVERLQSDLTGKPGAQVMRGVDAFMHCSISLLR